MTYDPDKLAGSMAEWVALRRVEQTFAGRDSKDAILAAAKSILSDERTAQSAEWLREVQFMKSALEALDALGFKVVPA